MENVVPLPPPIVNFPLAIRFSVAHAELRRFDEGLKARTDAHVHGDWGEWKT